MRGDAEIRWHEREVDKLREKWFALSEKQHALLTRAVAGAMVSFEEHHKLLCPDLNSPEFAVYTDRLRPLVQFEATESSDYHLAATELGRRVHFVPYVRVDLFKQSGKYYEHGYVDMRLFSRETVIQDAVLSACKLAHEKLNDSDWPLSTSPDDWLDNDGTIVCLEPFHVTSHPVTLRKHHFVKLPKGESTLRILPPEGESF